MKDKLRAERSAISRAYHLGKTTLEVFEGSGNVWMSFTVNPDTCNFQTIEISRNSAADFLKRMRRYQKIS